MTYGRTPLQELNLEGRRLLSRHYYGDGRWGWPPRTHQQNGVWLDWQVAKHRPKTTVWARATGSTRARKIHAIRYTLSATHSEGSQVHLTVWQCGGHANSAPLPESHPTMVCSGCFARLNGIREIVLDPG